MSIAPILTAIAGETLADSCIPLSPKDIPNRGHTTLALPDREGADPRNPRYVGDRIALVYTLDCPEERDFTRAEGRAAISP